jgi:Contractile injection system tube protein
LASDFSGSPLLLKGALVAFENPDRAVPTNIIAFQYNPDSVRRSVQPEVEYDWRARDGRGREPAKNILPPSETFDLEIELDAADQLETNNPIAQASGLHPTLAALELLAYPRSRDRVRASIEAERGQVRIGNVVLPVVLLVWGAPRVVPVAVSSISITEEAFDQMLNPIRARVSLGLRALADKELKDRPPFDKVSLVRHVAKEVLARANLFNSAEQARGMVGF